MKQSQCNLISNKIFFNKYLLHPTNFMDKVQNIKKIIFATDFMNLVENINNIIINNFITIFKLKAI